MNDEMILTFLVRGLDCYDWFQEDPYLAVRARMRGEDVSAIDPIDCADLNAWRFIYKNKSDAELREIRRAHLDTT